MGIISWLFGRGGVSEVAGAVERVGGVFRPNAEASAQRQATQHAGAMEQFGTEFQAAERKGWFNAMIDGLNRLPRPALAYGTIGLFVYAMRDPVGFGERMQGLALVPDQLWWLFGAIVTFYFGARELQYNRDASFAAPTMVRQVIDNVEAIRTLRPDDQADDDDQTEAITPSNNPALADWMDAKASST